MDSAVKQELGEKGEGADNQVMEENNDIGASGTATTMDQQQQQQQQQNLKKKKINLFKMMHVKKRMNH